MTNSPPCVVKKISGKGMGLVATRKIKKGEFLFRIDLRNLPKYTPEALDEVLKTNPNLDGDHADYAGRGKYVIDMSAGSYMNHSCDPNCYYKMRSIQIKDVIALKDIEKGEELTHDYTATSIDQFGWPGSWVLDCKCGSKNCRGTVTGDLLILPYKIIKKYWPNLPPSVKRKYRLKVDVILD